MAGVLLEKPTNEKMDSDEVDQEVTSYNHYHRRRFAFIKKIMGNCSGKNMLEFGAWGVKAYFEENGASVDTIGIYDKRASAEKHYELNFSTLPNGFPVIDKKYDVVLCCEVIEHLPISMDTMFEFLNSLVKMGGNVLIQTPNAVSLKNRLAMLMGKNPFPLIDKTSIHYHNHIREYTLPELIRIAESNGFAVVKNFRKNYFDYSHSVKAKLYEVIGYCLPESVKDGITILLSKINEKPVLNEIKYHKP